MKIKNLLSILTFIGIIGFVSCGDDDETCVTCELETMGISVTNEACEDSDGAVTLSVNGAAATAVTGTLSDWRTAQENLGATCN